MEIVQHPSKRRIEIEAPAPRTIDYHADGVPACCGNCPYWSVRADMAVGLQPGGHPAGECRFDPPKNMPVPVVDRLGQQQIAINAFFPTIVADYWCGKHPQRDAARRDLSLIASKIVPGA